MTIFTGNDVVNSFDYKQDNLIKLQQGEIAIKNAPKVELANGNACVPQHYLVFKHNRESIEKIILDIDFCQNYPIFVGVNTEGFYIQVGVIGFDNYERSPKVKDKKIVYGRKWRVEANLPTSEIIQTVFLALKTAREHEVRELFTLQHQNKLVTVFNNHHDLPVLAKSKNVLENSTQNLTTVADLKQTLIKITYDHAQFKLVNIEQRLNGQWLIDIEILAHKETRLPELLSSQGSTCITLMMKALALNTFYYVLFDELLKLSNEYVEANFSYQRFNRFAKSNNVLALADLSIALRKKSIIHQHDDFLKDFARVNYETDETRVPKLHQGALKDKIQHKLQTIPRLTGILPL